MKDAYYFPHDSNSKDDPKCVMLIEQLGMEGYGIFWVLIETLREQPEYKYPLSLIPALARRYCTTAEKAKAVVMSYGLFQIENDEFFYSKSLNQRMEIYAEKKEKYRLAGKASAQKRLNSAENEQCSNDVPTMLEHRCNDVPTMLEQRCNDVPTSKVKESKVNKTKVNEIIEDIADKPQKLPRKKYGDYGHVKLTDEEYARLLTDYSESTVKAYIKKIDEYCQMKGKAYKDYNLTIRKWAGNDNQKTGTVDHDHSDDDFAEMSLRRTPKL